MVQFGLGTICRFGKRVYFQGKEDGKVGVFDIRTTEEIHYTREKEDSLFRFVNEIYGR